MVQKLILFDIDKTLVKEMERSSNPWPQAFESVYGIKCGITISQANSHGMTHKQIAIETLKNQGLKEGEIFKKMNLFIKILEKIYKKSLENGKITLFPKIPELLQKLSKKKYVLGLITGNTKEIALAKLKMAKIDKFFSIGGFGNDSANREELIKLALERAEEKYHFQFDEKKIFVIGDTPKDIIPAKKFHLQTIGVATGLYSKSQLKESGADFVLNNLEDIDKVLSIIG